jgi:hypothetical protein
MAFHECRVQLWIPLSPSLPRSKTVPECSSGRFHCRTIKALSRTWSAPSTGRRCTFPLQTCNCHVFGPSTTAVTICRFGRTTILNPRWYGDSTSISLFYRGGYIHWWRTGMHLSTPTKTSLTIRTPLSRTTPGKFHLTQCHNSERVPGYLVSWLGFEAGVSRIPDRKVRSWWTFSFSVTVRVTIRQNIK